MSIFNKIVKEIFKSNFRIYIKKSYKKLFLLTKRTVLSKTYRPLILFTVPYIPAIVLAKNAKNESIERVIAIADDLYARNDVVKLNEYLSEYLESDSSDILWRLCRAAFEKAKYTDDEKVKKELIFKAMEFVQLALQKDPNNFACHKWYAIMLDHVGGYEGTKARISKAFIVKQHFLKAIELNPKDATSLYSLGYWCFVFADLPWYQRKIASVIFATPPSSTFEEALEYFLKAEEVNPGFYNNNLLMIGKTYLRLNQLENAKQFLTRVVQSTLLTRDDKLAHEEAEALLKSL